MYQKEFTKKMKKHSIVVIYDPDSHMISKKSLSCKFACFVSENKTVMDEKT